MALVVSGEGRRVVGENTEERGVHERSARDLKRCAAFDSFAERRGGHLPTCSTVRELEAEGTEGHRDVVAARGLERSGPFDAARGSVVLHQRFSARRHADHVATFGRGGDFERVAT